MRSFTRFNSDIRISRSRQVSGSRDRGACERAGRYQDLEIEVPAKEQADIRISRSRCLQKSRQVSGSRDRGACERAGAGCDGSAGFGVHGLGSGFSVWGRVQDLVWGAGFSLVWGAEFSLVWGAGMAACQPRLISREIMSARASMCDACTRSGAHLCVHTNTRAHTRA